MNTGSTPLQYTQVPLDTCAATSESFLVATTSLQNQIVTTDDEIDTDGSSIGSCHSISSTVMSKFTDTVHEANPGALKD